MLDHITTVYARDREFYVARDERGFWGIETKNFDASGKLTVQLTGISGMLSRTAADAVQSILDRVETEYLVEQGVDLNTAILRVFDARIKAVRRPDPEAHHA